jgi:hypothetical protein
MHLANCRSLTSPTDSSDGAKFNSSNGSARSGAAAVQKVNKLSRNLSGAHDTVLQCSYGARGTRNKVGPEGVGEITTSPPEMASAYIDAYSQVSEKSRSEILNWLPFVAAARLAEGVPEIDDQNG